MQRGFEQLLHFENDAVLFFEDVTNEFSEINDVGSKALKMKIIFHILYRLEIMVRLL